MYRVGSTQTLVQIYNTITKQNKNIPAQFLKQDLAIHVVFRIFPEWFVSVVLGILNCPFSLPFCFLPAYITSNFNIIAIALSAQR